MMRRHRRELDTISEINITNLLDTCFVLLIAFFMVAPTLKSGIPVELPKTEGTQSLQDNQKDNENFIITIAPRGPEGLNDRIYLNGKMLRMEDLRTQMETAYAANPKVSVTVESDGQVVWGTVAEVVGMVNGIGIENFTFSTEPQSLETMKKPEPGKRGA
ncbi:MAG: biopolymer transporter ExbD [Candidatus Sumerlaeota bacterium]|nr:biopolymer transporter ExbD [Candidatus Sumerlaeota bacterium]